jgi:hypothetical protein
MVAHAYNPTIWEAEAGEQGVEASLSYIRATLSQKSKNYLVM